MTATVVTLEAHTNEVWYIQWSHDGVFLASASKDKSAIIWRKASPPSATTSTQDWSAHLVLRDHPYPVGRLAWSLDDKVLLTSSEGTVKMWDTATGRCIHTLEGHSDTIASICWLRDSTGFVTGSLDQKIIVWNKDGQVRQIWDGALRITDLAIKPDPTRLVVIGLERDSLPDASRSEHVGTTEGREDPGSRHGGGVLLPRRLIVYDFATKEVESDNHFDGDLTDLQISTDSQFALINKAPNEICLWDLKEKQLRHRYKGQKQGRHVIRSCFGGPDESLIVSGSEDGNVYMWDRDSETPLEILSGHGDGSVNTVAWNPVRNNIFASCSDDHTIRIWQVSSSDGEELKVDRQAGVKKIKSDKK